MNKPLQLILLRHGESEWNLLNQFTGWTDVDLTKNGIQEAQLSAKKILQENNEVIKSLKKTYKNSYNRKLVNKYNLDFYENIHISNHIPEHAINILYKLVYKKPEKLDKNFISRFIIKAKKLFNISVFRYDDIIGINNIISA